jgi:hypothetical protein
VTSVLLSKCHQQKAGHTPVSLQLPLFHVSWRRTLQGIAALSLTKQIIETFGEDALPPETLATTEREYAEVKDKFMVKSCKSKTCSEQRIGHTWSKLDFVSMAKRTGVLGSLIVPNYFVPLRHAHSTFRAMTERLEMGGDKMGFRRESQPKEADQALMAAHNCLLMALEVQKERFNIPGLEEALQRSCSDWALVWSPESLAPEQPEVPNPHPSE